MIRVIYYAIWAVFLAALQPTLARGIAICGIAPNLFLCFVVMTAFFRGKREGAICGMIFGLLYDFLIGRMVGVNGLCYFYLGFGAGWMSERFFSGGKRLAASLTILTGTILAGLVYYFARMAVYGDSGFVTAIFRIALPEGFYNAGIGFLLSFPIRGTLKLLRIERIS